jgi:hypothetical protein
MRMRSSIVGIGLVLIGSAAIVSAGCGGPTVKKGGPAKTSASVTTAAPGEWWCREHGVPEEICTQCSQEAAAEFKKKGDWCKEHDRAESQCFICHPEREAKFAAEYEAKYGKKPPAREEEKEDASRS